MYFNFSGVEDTLLFFDIASCLVVTGACASIDQLENSLKATVSCSTPAPDILPTSPTDSFGVPAYRVSDI